MHALAPPLALAVLATSACLAAPRADVQALVSQVEEARLRAHVEGLCALGPRPAGDPAASRRALDWLRGELEGLGLAVREEPFRASLNGLVWSEQEGERVWTLVTREHELVNLLAELPGDGRPWQVIELGAHYDSVHESVGADDNASGVAVLLELARVLRERPRDRTIRLCFFAGEERGLLGSAHHAARIARRDDERLLGAIVLDMVGYADRSPGSQTTPVRIPLLFDLPRTADFVLVAGNYPSGGIGNLVEDSADRYVPSLAYYSVNRVAGFVSDGWRSDHASYWRNGLRAIQLGDSADLRSPHYHQASDTPDTLDYAFLADVARAVVAAVAEWSD